MPAWSKGTPGWKVLGLQRSQGLTRVVDLAPIGQSLSVSSGKKVSTAVLGHDYMTMMHLSQHDHAVAEGGRLTQVSH